LEHHFAIKRVQQTATARVRAAEARTAAATRLTAEAEETAATAIVDREALIDAYEARLDAAAVAAEHAKRRVAPLRAGATEAADAIAELTDLAATTQRSGLIRIFGFQV
jgi:hypothetical protein